MPMKRVQGVVASLALSLALGACAGAAEVTTPPDYRFDIVQQPVKVGQNSEITVRLVHLPTGQVVKDATISRSELEMPMLRQAYKAPPSSLPMEEDVWYLGSDAQGTYRFRGNISMGGTWILNIWAQVPGEAESIRGALRFKAVS